MAAQLSSQKTHLENELAELAAHPLPFVVSCRLSTRPFREQPLDFATVDPINDTGEGEGTHVAAKRLPPVFSVQAHIPKAALYLCISIKATGGSGSSSASPYDYRTYPIHLTFSEEYPREPPRVRWACVMNHSQVDPLHFCDNLLYESTSDSKGSGWRVVRGAHCDAKMEAAADHSSLRAILTAVHGMLYAPLPQVIPSSMDDLDIYHTIMHRQGICIRDNPGLIDEHDMRAAVAKERLEFPRRAASMWRAMAENAQQVIASTRAYQPLHRDLFSHTLGWHDEWFDDNFLRVLRTDAKNQPSALAAFITEDAPRVYSFPLFTSTYCDALLAELKNYEQTKLLKSRPNSMNKFGLILNDIGMELMMDILVRTYLRPILAILYPDVGGDTIDHHHSFIVQYRPDADRNLDMHTDDSDVTLNACISTDFEGGGLDFCGLAGHVDQRKFNKQFVHQRGRGVLHLGRQRHGARDTTAGERNNLIIWCKSSTYRQSKAYSSLVPNHEHEVTPDRQCLSRTHDHDYDFFMQLHRRQDAARHSSISTSSTTASAGEAATIANSIPSVN